MFVLAAAVSHSPASETMSSPLLSWLKKCGWPAMLLGHRDCFVQEQGFGLVVGPRPAIEGRLWSLDPWAILAGDPLERVARQSRHSKQSIINQMAAPSSGTAWLRERARALRRRKKASAHHIGRQIALSPHSL